MSRTKTQRWAAGRYVLLSDRFMQKGTHHDVVRGDFVELDASDALRLGNAGCIAPEGSPEAVKARQNPGEMKQQRLRELEEEMARLKRDEPTAGHGESPPEGTS